MMSTVTYDGSKLCVRCQHHRPSYQTLLCAAGTSARPIDAERHEHGVCGPAGRRWRPLHADTEDVEMVE